MDYKKIGKHLQDEIEDLYFNCVFTCTHGESWISSIAGTSNNFIMWRGIVIWDSGILEINPGCKGIEEEVTLQILDLLDVEFVHALGTNKFGEVKDYYKIKGIKFVERYEEEVIEDDDDYELVEIPEEYGELEPIEDDLEYIISCQIKNKNIEILNTIKKYPESETENYWMIGIDINKLTEEELQSLSIFDRDFW